MLGMRGESGWRVGYGCGTQGIVLGSGVWNIGSDDVGQEGNGGIEWRA